MCFNVSFVKYVSISALTYQLDSHSCMRIDCFTEIVFNYSSFDSIFQKTVVEMAENHTNAEAKEKRVRQEILDQLKHVTNVSEFARENGLTRRNLYMLKQQEEKLRAAITAKPLTKPMRKRLNPVTAARVIKRQKMKGSSDSPKADSSAATVKLQDEESGYEIEVKPKLTNADSENEITGRLGDTSQLRLILNPYRLVDKQIKKYRSRMCLLAPNLLVVAKVFLLLIRF